MPIMFLLIMAFTAYFADARYLLVDIQEDMQGDIQGDAQKMFRHYPPARPDPGLGGVPPWGRHQGISNCTEFLC